MAFEKGNKLSVGRGRPQGAVSHRKRELDSICEKHNCDPFEVLIMFAKGDWKGLGYDNEVYHKEGAAGETSLGYVISPELRAQCAKEACQYIQPKLKSVEHHKPPSPLDGMSPEQKLEAMKQAVKMLEGEMDSNDS